MVDVVRARDNSPENFGWEKIELKPNAGSVLLPLSWGLLPLALTLIVYFTKTGMELINFLGAGSVLLMLVGGIGAVSTRQGIFNSLKVGLGFFFSCLSLFSWLMVANNNFAVEWGIASSFLAFIMIFRTLDFIFKDANLIYQTNWSAKSRLPTESMAGWDIRSRRFAQNTMALKRFDKDSFAHIYGTRTLQGLAIRLDVFGVRMGERFDFRLLGLDLTEFIVEDE
ncbi:MAG: hypothetical protein ISP82_02370 [Candidatus Poseidoniaceae archaeon]|nr:hypothetical protein [Candidatus Poseidoniaceae archaeon]MBL6896095.1 hypothetical protein [Candidatus Poseidoniaceae archaeon]